jgi:hypothetical protein
MLSIADYGYYLSPLDTDIGYIFDLQIQLKIIISLFDKGSISPREAFGFICGECDTNLFIRDAEKYFKKNSNGNSINDEFNENENEEAVEWQKLYKVLVCYNNTLDEFEKKIYETMDNQKSDYWIKREKECMQDEAMIENILRTIRKNETNSETFLKRIEEIYNDIHIIKEKIVKE